LQSFKVQKSV